jgi:elongation factor G
MLSFDEQSLGQEVVRSPIPAEHKEEFTAARMALLEKLADFDEAVMEKYLDDKPVTVEEIYRALRKATLALRLFLCSVAAPLKIKEYSRCLTVLIRYSAVTGGY